MLDGITFDIALLQLASSSRRLVRNSPNSNYVIAAVNQATQALDCKIGSPEKNYLQFLFSHNGVINS